MLYNYLKIAFRNAWRHRAVTAVNVLGLTTGLTACLLIATFVLDELSFDQFWPKADRIYRLVRVSMNGNSEERSASVTSGYAPKFKEVFPEIEAYTRDTRRFASVQLSRGKTLVKGSILCVEPGAFKMLDIQLVRGSVDAKSFLGIGFGPKDILKVVLNQTMATALFGAQNPIGQMISWPLPYAPPGNCLVIGVMRDMPTNTHLQADVLLPIHMGAEVNEDLDLGWIYPQYVLLAPHADPKRVAAKATDYLNRNLKSKENIRVELQPIKDIRLYSSGIDASSERESDIQYVLLFSAIGGFLLLLACINFINLTIARSLQRAHETGIRKVLGAQRAALIQQFLMESGLIFGISLLLALGLYSQTIPLLFDFVGREMTANPFENGRLLAAIIGVVALVSALAGLYPALVLSSFQPARVLRGVRARLSGGRFSLQSTLVVVQFVVSLVLLVATFVVYRQLRFVNETNLGFRKDNLLMVRGAPQEKTSIKEELLRNPNILSISFTNWVPGGKWEGTAPREIEDPTKPGEKATIWSISTDFSFLKTLQIPLVDGRDFSTQFANDRLDLTEFSQQDTLAFRLARQDKSIIVNQTLVRKLGLKNPIGYRLHYQRAQGTIIGVMKDFNSGPLRRSLPMMYLDANPENSFSGAPLIRVRAGKLAETTAYVEKTWKHFFPDRLFEYHYADEQLEKLYTNEQRLGTLFAAFAGLAILISCLGLFGLVTLVTQEKAKEIGIRKVLGASVSSIVFLLSKGMFKLVIIAIVIASPLAWYAMNQWLQGFAYRLDLAWWVFALAGLLAISIALLTVGFQSVKAALMNPVKSLKSE